MKATQPKKIPHYSEDYLLEGMMAQPEQILDWLQEAVIFNYEATKGREWVRETQDKYRQGKLKEKSK